MIWVANWRPFDFEGGPQIQLFDIEANRMRKNGFLDRVLRKHEFSIDVRCQNEMSEMVKVVFLHYAYCNLKGLGGHEH